MIKMDYFSVKNFEQFQHYKDRTPVWIKLYNTLLDDYEFNQLPEVTRWHLIGIWLLASRQNNRVPDDSGWISSKINSNKSDLIKSLLILKEAGFIAKILKKGRKPASKTLAKCLPREEKRREEDTVLAHSGTWDPPAGLNLEAWKDFEAYRKTTKSKLTDLARTKASAKLLILPPDKQQACVDTTIANGWTGLFPERFMNGKNWPPKADTAIVPGFEDAT